MNLLPYHVYESLQLGDLKPTTITLQFADRREKRPRGVVEDVLVQVDKLYFPVDFVVLDTNPVANMKTQIPVILGRPFLATANALVNCRTGVMQLTFGNMTVELNVFNIGKQPGDDEDIFEVNRVGITSPLTNDETSDPLLLCLVNVGVEDHTPSPEESEMSKYLDGMAVYHAHDWIPKFEGLGTIEKKLIPSHE